MSGNLPGIVSAGGPWPGNDAAVPPCRCSACSVRSSAGTGGSARRPGGVAMDRDVYHHPTLSWKMHLTREGRGRSETGGTHRKPVVQPKACRSPTAIMGGPQSIELFIGHEGLASSRAATWFPQWLFTWVALCGDSFLEQQSNILRESFRPPRCSGAGRLSGHWIGSAEHRLPSVSFAGREGAPHENYRHGGRHIRCREPLVCTGSSNALSGSGLSSMA